MPGPKHKSRPKENPRAEVETMRSLSTKFSAAETGVFWDLGACPIPTGQSPVSISANIKLALQNMGYTGKVSIFAYSVANQSEKVNFESAEIAFVNEGSRQEKLRSMFRNLYMWGVEHRDVQTNLMVISKDLFGDEFISGLVSLNEKENNLLIAHPRKNPRLLRDIATSVWLWESLSTGGSPLNGYRIRPDSPTPSPPCPCCSRRAVRFAEKRMNPPPKPGRKLGLKWRKRSRANPDPPPKRRKSSTANPDPED